MPRLQIKQARFRLSDTQVLDLHDLTIHAGESWAFIGANGSGKSSLARALSGELAALDGYVRCDFIRPVRLSLEQLQKLVADEWQRNNSDLLSEDEEDYGFTAAEIIQQQVKNSARCLQLAGQFAITHLLKRRFRYLSTGETRKVLLCRILMSQPDLLILDEPFDGLDVDSRANLAALLAVLHQQQCTIVMVLNRFDDIPAFIQQIGILAECTLAHAGLREQMLAQTVVAQLAHSEQLNEVVLPEPDVSGTRPVLAQDIPLVILRNGTVRRDDKLILDGIDWQVRHGEHWHIVGPNGAGKSTLLSLITGDHPQSYSNDLTLFGRRRGSGETIWDIKQHIGYVSSSLHLEYRVSSRIRDVIVSGYFDSIGVYQAVSDRQEVLLQRWLELLGFDTAMANTPFQSLSWGQQRLILIARALVKHPALLILDEPMQGLDPLNRQLVRRLIDILIDHGHTQLLFVSHHTADAPACITHRLTFVPEGNSYRYQQERLAR